MNDHHHQPTNHEDIMKNLTINITNLSLTFTSDAPDMSVLLGLLHAVSPKVPTDNTNTTDDFPPDLGAAPDTCTTDAAPIHPNQIVEGDHVRYTRADGTGFTGDVLSTEGDYDDRTLAIRIHRDDTDNIVVIIKIGDDMTGKFFLLD